VSAPKLEAFLAKLYVDNQARSRFFADPRREALSAGLTPDECVALETIDLVGLELAAQSFARKRAVLARKSSAWRRWLKRLRSIYVLGKRSGTIEPCNASGRT
jgi:hypothetical protein